MKFCHSIAFASCHVLLLVACDQSEKVSMGSKDEPPVEAKEAVPPKMVGEVIVDVAEELVVPVPEVEVTTPSIDFDMTIEPGYVAKSIKEWIPEYHRVDAVLYDWSADGKSQDLVQSGKLHVGVVKKFTKTLTEDQIDRLEKLVTGSRSKELGAFCYYPHHGFVFYDKSDKILGHLELCLMCGNYQYAPCSMKKGEGPLSDNWDLDGMEKLLKDLGFPMFNHPKKWEEFFAEQK